jgi:hypothetical protein
MNRRTFLQILGAAGVAIVATPQAVVARALDPTVGPPLVPITPAVPSGMQTIRITFPDGTAWQMQGFVTSQTVDCPIDGVSESTVQFQPTGPCECLDESYKPEGNVTVDGSPVKRRRGQPTQRGQVLAPTTTVSLDGVDVGELQDIQLPRMRAELIDVTRDPAFTGMPEDHREYIPGLKRVSPMTFTVNFDGRMHLP